MTSLLTTTVETRLSPAFWVKRITFVSPISWTSITSQCPTSSEVGGTWREGERERGRGGGGGGDVCVGGCELCTLSTILGRAVAPMVLHSRLRSNLDISLHDVRDQ